MENTNNENQDLNELLKQLTETQGEGDELFMVGSVEFDESKVNETLFEKMETLYQDTKKKMGEWSSKYDRETIEVTSMQHDYDNGATFLKPMLGSPKVNDDLLNEMRALTDIVISETNQWSLDYSEDVIENTSIKHSQITE